MIMITFLSKENVGSHVSSLYQMHRLRKQVFSDRLGWSVAVSGDLEVDEYDALAPKYDNGQAVYPPWSEVYKELSRAAVDQVMELLANRGMVRKSGSVWHAITPGRLEPSTRRAVAALLACRADLPPALAAELDSWNRTLDAMQAPSGMPPSQAAKAEAIQSAKPLHAIAAG